MRKLLILILIFLLSISIMGLIGCKTEVEDKTSSESSIEESSSEIGDESINDSSIEFSSDDESDLTESNSSEEESISDSSSEEIETSEDTSSSEDVVSSEEVSSSEQTSSSSSSSSSEQTSSSSSSSSSEQTSSSSSSSSNEQNSSGSSGDVEVPVETYTINFNLSNGTSANSITYTIYLVDELTGETTSTLYENVKGTESVTIEEGLKIKIKVNTVSIPNVSFLITKFKLVSDDTNFEKSFNGVTNYTTDVILVGSNITVTLTIETDFYVP